MNSNPDTAEAKIREVVERHMQEHAVDFKAGHTDLLIQQLKELLVDARIDEAEAIFAELWDTDGARFQYDDPPKEILDRIAALQQTRQEEVRE